MLVPVLVPVQAGACGGLADGPKLVGWDGGEGLGGSRVELRDRGTAREDARGSDVRSRGPGWEGIEGG